LVTLYPAYIHAIADWQGAALRLNGAFPKRQDVRGRTEGGGWVDRGAVRLAKG
jgi:hypothetical protein